MHAEIIDDAAALEPLRPTWDGLAAAAGLPMATSAWALGWWRHMRPERSLLRVVVVRAGAEVVAIAPYFVQDTAAARIDYRLLGSGFATPLSPLACPAVAWQAAAALAGALATARPAPDMVTFEGLPLSSPWPAMVRERWPGLLRPTAFRPWILSAPTVSLEHCSFAAWFATRSANFRSQMRRGTRDLERAGGQVRASTPASLGDDLEALFRLHAGRWEGRGRSALVPAADALRGLFADLGREQVACGRLRLQVVEVEGAPISVQLFANDGDAIVYWNGGWDERYAKLRPAMLGILAEVEAGIADAARVLSLGGGAQGYKLRFADGSEPLEWGHLLVPRARAAAIGARMIPASTFTVARRLAQRGLTDEQRERLRALRRRLRRTA
ncbi:GNAT family N-acetyltransferase [Conexibacter stalactiti]|uniref:GNAT family N-acetyltransferase n=1 Tax=Conexibacter stalactiti TaxID=1940611 RepID=A0ABU4HX77_9ACTN|nr:GNAT family N-acetyltransferase [Conexibacter stalactiti]MDW5597774.1 GNAT family N-acetyltransferase [Conexibacter stalactiti]MEC5038416.1 GNAT family N-acetyltransferase [Conexibacter stalactiti]